MKYNPAKHIKHGDLAIEAGVESSALTGLVARGACPEPVGRERVGRSLTSFYDRTEALLWAAQMRPEPTGEIVPVAQPRPLCQQGTYRPSAQMSINQQRAAELYPHRLYTPDGVGNGVERQNGYGRGQ